MAFESAKRAPCFSRAKGQQRSRHTVGCAAVDPSDGLAGSSQHWDQESGLARDYFTSPDLVGALVVQYDGNDLLVLRHGARLFVSGPTASAVLTAGRNPAASCRWQV